MTDRRFETGSGSTVPATAVEAAAELARLVREATVDLPFGAEPAAFLAGTGAAGRRRRVAARRAELLHWSLAELAAAAARRARSAAARRRWRCLRRWTDRAAA